MYGSLFLEKEHRITIRSRKGRHPRVRMFFNEKNLGQILDQQQPDEDIYITKYPKSRLVQVLIFDFDSEDLSEAYKDVKRCFNYFMRKGNNSVIVESGSKGYHLYVQIAPFVFDNVELRNWGDFDYNLYFKKFVNRLFDDIETNCLDEVNLSAGLNGNIRVVGSKHPKTGKTCRIIEGEFKDLQPPTELSDYAFRLAYEDVKICIEAAEFKARTSVELIKGNDPVAVNDCREVFRKLTGDIKLYDRGYGYCKCPFHSDNNPSLLVTKEFYSCSACGEKGNVWTLAKKGLVTFDDDGRVK